MEWQSGREGYWRLKYITSKLKRLDIVQLKVKNCSNFFCIIGFSIVIVFVGFLGIMLCSSAEVAFCMHSVNIYIKTTCTA